MASLIIYTCVYDVWIAIPLICFTTHGVQHMVLNFGNKRMVTEHLFVHGQSHMVYVIGVSSAGKQMMKRWRRVLCEESQADDSKEQNYSIFTPIYVYIYILHEWIRTRSSDQSSWLEWRRLVMPKSVSEAERHWLATAAVVAIAVIGSMVNNQDGLVT